MGFGQTDIEVLKSGGGSDIKDLILRKQKDKTATKSVGMTERKIKAARLEQETRAWEDLIFNPHSPMTVKLSKLAEWNGNDMIQQVHYVVLLDKSGSMAGSNWNQLTKAFQSFKGELLRDPLTAAATRVTLILFNHEAQTVEPTHAKPAELQDIGHHIVGGGTNFHAAFAECHKLLGRSQFSSKDLILFLTDGGAAVPQREISELLADHGRRIQGLTCIAFGAHAHVQALEQMGGHFSAQGITFRLTKAGDEASLVETFISEAAMSRAIHT